MRYIDALNLIEKCIKSKILVENNHGNVYVYREEGIKGNKAGWYITPKDTLAKELMLDSDGQSVLKKELQKKERAI